MGIANGFYLLVEAMMAKKEDDFSDKQDGFMLLSLIFFKRS